ncbi:hypothetical protein CONPUDRAFT_38983, partial [Coniophora puteana RWD-64-598 SS2]
YGVECPLLYVHWYREFHTVDPRASMFVLEPASHRDGPSAQVVPATLLLRPCHLIPRFGKHPNISW